METLLYLAHSEEDGSLSKTAFEVLSAAQDIKKDLQGTKLIVGLIGGSVTAAVSAVGSCGAENFLEVSGPDFSSSRYASDAAAMEAIIHAAKPTIVLVPSSSRFNRAIAGVVQRLGGRIDTHVSGFKIENNKLQIQRWYYRQRMSATLTRSTRPWFLVCDSGVFQPYQGVPSPVSAEKCPVILTESHKRTKVVGLVAPSSNAQTIRPDAKLLFVAGAGWTKKQSDGQAHLSEAAKLIMEVLEKTKASLGSSKSLVDQSSEGQAVFSFMSHLNQVGQTGSTPRHLKGLSTCCHGEEPHVVGWRFINDRRAVNLDANCGWAQGKADVLYVADAFKVVAKVNELLAKSG